MYVRNASFLPRQLYMKIENIHRTTSHVIAPLKFVKRVKIVSWIKNSPRRPTPHTLLKSLTLKITAFCLSGISRSFFDKKLHSNLFLLEWISCSRVDTCNNTTNIDILILVFKKKKLVFLETADIGQLLCFCLARDYAKKEKLLI